MDNELISVAQKFQCQIKILARRFLFAFTVLASFYSKSFLLGTLYELNHSFQLSGKNRLKTQVSTDSTTPAYTRLLKSIEGFEPPKNFITEKFYYPSL